MQYKVPQNIDLEDKVIGPLTLKQFIYLLVAGMLDYLIYSTFTHWIGWVLIVVISGIALAFAFLKVQEQDFGYFLSAFVSFILSPKLFVWTKHTVSQEEDRLPKVNKEEEKDDDQLTKDPKEVRSRLQVLAEVVDTHGWQHKDTGSRVVSEEESESRVEKTEERKEGIDDPLNEIDKV
jgi:hypothetical protein